MTRMVNKITDIGKNITAMISINLLVKDVAKIGQISSLIFILRFKVGMQSSTNTTESRIVSNTRCQNLV
jgi:hypothetical protein